MAADQVTGTQPLGTERVGEPQAQRGELFPRGLEQCQSSEAQSHSLRPSAQPSLALTVDRVQEPVVWTLQLLGSSTSEAGLTRHVA